MADIVTQLPCEHQHFKTTCAASVARRKKKIIGYQLSITAQCATCGVCFHFPNLPVDEDSKKFHVEASVSNKRRILTVPIRPGAFAPELN